MRYNILKQVLPGLILFVSGWSLHFITLNKRPSAPISYSDALNFRNHFKSTIDTLNLFPDYFLIDSSMLAYFKMNPEIEKVRVYLIRYNNSQKPPTFPSGTINVVYAPIINGNPDVNRLFNYTGICPPDCGSNFENFLK